MEEKKNMQMKGIVLTLLGGSLWGFCGGCGQFLFQYKEVTSGWLVPLRLTFAGAMILLLLACIEPVAATVVSAVWLKVSFQPVDLVGFVFVLSTVFIISLNQKKEGSAGKEERRLQHG